MRRILALALLMALVAACGGDSRDQSGNTAEPTSTTNPPETTTTSAAPVETPATVATQQPDTTIPEPADTTGATSTVPPTTGEQADTPTTSTTSSTTTTTTTIPEPVLPPSPLTGLGVEDPDLLSRRTMAVKVDNHWDGRPQTGIGEADAVFELLVEGGITRFIALYHTIDPPAVGPVRSVRPTDPHLLRNLGATLLTSGGQNWILNQFPRNGVGVIGEVGEGGYRDRSRRAPHNYYVRPAQLRSVADERLYPDTAPPPLFEFGSLPDNAVLGSVFEVAMEWAPGNLVTWRWNGVAWERHLPDGPHLWTSAPDVTEVITAENLVVLFSQLFYTKPPSGSGYALPTMATTGEGRALVFSQGQVVAGQWERPETSENFTLSTSQGSPLTVPPGRSWISLFPEGRPVTW